MVEYACVQLEALVTMLQLTFVQFEAPLMMKLQLEVPLLMLQLVAPLLQLIHPLLQLILHLLQLV